jgi:phosphohistidine phosphatase SixA
MSITIMRHGESEWNVGLNKLDFNSNLTENGKNLAEKLEGYYDIVICSTLKRTLQTLEASNIKYNTLLRTNLCDGVDGKTKEQVINNVIEFKKYVKELDPVKNKILVISHMYFIKEFCGKELRNLEKVKYEI